MKSEYMLIIITNGQCHKDPNMIPIVQIGGSQLGN